MNITILGGTGFVGSNLISCLDKTGNNIAVITRNREKNKKILVYPKVKLIEADVHNQEDLLSATRNTDVLINLIGILNEKGHSGRGFRKAHSDLARNILNACKNNEIKRILHMSALNANSKGPSHYLRTKGEAESYLMTYGKRFGNITVFRPSNFIINSIKDTKSFNKQYNLCGPKVYTLKEILELIVKTKNKKTKIIPLSKKISKMQAVFMEFIPGKPFSLDNFNSCQVDSFCKSDFEFYSDLETIIPTYITPDK